MVYYEVANKDPKLYVLNYLIDDADTEGAFNPRNYWYFNSIHL